MIFLAEMQWPEAIAAVGMVFGFAAIVWAIAWSDK
jgi:hypothetical protein